MTSLIDTHKIIFPSERHSGTLLLQWNKFRFFGFLLILYFSSLDIEVCVPICGTSCAQQYLVRTKNESILDLFFAC